MNSFGCRAHPSLCHAFLYLLGEFATHGNSLLSDSGPWDKGHQNKRTVQFGGGLGIAEVYYKCVWQGLVLARLGWPSPGAAWFGSLFFEVIRSPKRKNTIDARASFCFG